MSESSPLDGLANPGGPLHREPPDGREYANLVKSGEARLLDAEREDNSVDGRFDLAYNAAHALCLAALRRTGYRPSKRYIVFQSLPHTLGLGPEVWRVLDRAHNERNRTEYEGSEFIDVRLLKDMIAAGRTVLKALHALPPLD
jgi:hypothetical protein